MISWGKTRLSFYQFSSKREIVVKVCMGSGVLFLKWIYFWCYTVYTNHAKLCMEFTGKAGKQSALIYANSILSDGSTALALRVISITMVPAAPSCVLATLISSDEVKPSASHTPGSARASLCPLGSSNAYANCIMCRVSAKVDISCD